MQKVWIVSRYVLAAVALLLAALMGLGWYVASSKEAARQSSPFVQKLDRLERERGDVLKLLFEGMASLGSEQAEVVIDWLTERQHGGELPYLYVIGLYHAKLVGERKKLQGLEYLARGALVYRVDALHCGDPSANQAVAIFEGAIGLQRVRDSLKGRPALRQKVVASALEFEEKRKHRPRPEWVCRHGVGQAGPAPAEDLVRAQRQKMRAQFEGSF